MSLVDITPVMTSNTTPSPYAVTSSGIYSATYDSWKAFDNNMSTDNCWATPNAIITGWIMFNYSTPTTIDAFSIANRNFGASTALPAAPKDFNLYGSNDGLSFTLIEAHLNEILWNSGESRLFLLKQSVTFQYYRLNIITNNGYATYSQIGEIKFWKNNGIIPSNSNNTMSMTLGLSHNSTLSMKQRVNDNREGLLGFADDSDNYGTLWMINNKGQAEIPKAAITDGSVLFNGLISAINSIITFSESIDKYKYLLVTAGNSTNNLTFNTLVEVRNILYTAGNQYILSEYATSGANTHIRFNITSSTTIKIAENLSNNWAMGIVRIIGIK